MGQDQCFVCGKSNPNGLHVTFAKHGDAAVAHYRCREEMNGWSGIQHGGITAALLDEASAYVPYFMGLTAVTAKMEIEFVKPIQVGERLRVEGRPIRKTKRIIEVEAEIAGENGDVKARSTAKMMILSSRQKEELGLPDPDDA